MKIAQIRDAIDRLNWVRMDATGGTPIENLRTNLPGRLASYIAAVESLVIAPRFYREIQRRKTALWYAEKVIAQWHRNHEAAMQDACINSEWQIG